MAYRKFCDYDDVELGVDDTSFLNLWGSLSEQIEENDDGQTMYRYLTPARDTKLAFCDITCLVGWIEQQRKRYAYKVKEEIL